MTARDFSKSRQQRQERRAVYDEAGTLAQARHVDKLTNLWVGGGEPAMQRALRAAELARNYEGRSTFLLSVREQARRAGPTWIPSPKQVDAILRNERLPATR